MHATNATKHDFAEPVGIEELRSLADDRAGWLWEGYLARGEVTLLTGQWKGGKTTLAAVLLAKLKRGGELAGQKLSAGRAIIISEEAPIHWIERSRRLDFEGHVWWLCRPFHGKPTPDRWTKFVGWVGSLSSQRGVDLVLIDPLAAFLPGRDENNAGLMLEALLPLGRLAESGPAVLVLHHPRKGDPPIGQAARGSGALAGFVDVSIELRQLRGSDSTDRKRRLLAFSRHPQTPRDVVVELDESGTDYVTLGEIGQIEFAARWEMLLGVLEDAPYKLTRRQIRERWPEDDPVADDTTLWRWLEHAVALGLAFRDGSGRRRDPFRYWPASQPEKTSDPIQSLLDQTALDLL